MHRKWQLRISNMLTVRVRKNLSHKEKRTPKPFTDWTAPACCCAKMTRVKKEYVVLMTDTEVTSQEVKGSGEHANLSSVSLWPDGWSLRGVQNGCTSVSSQRGGNSVLWKCTEDNKEQENATLTDPVTWSYFSAIVDPWTFPLCENWTTLEGLLFPTRYLDLTS